MSDHANIVREILRSIAYPGSVAGSTRKKDAALAALDALEEELDALADVAFAGNEREKRLEAELAEAHRKLGLTPRRAEDTP